MLMPYKTTNVKKSLFERCDTSCRVSSNKCQEIQLSNRRTDRHIERIVGKNLRSRKRYRRIKYGKESKKTKPNEVKKNKIVAQTKKDGDAEKIKKRKIERKKKERGKVEEKTYHIEKGKTRWKITQ